MPGSTPTTLRDIFFEISLSKLSDAFTPVSATEDYVQSNPWQSVGIAAGVGFLIGLLASRR